MVDRCLSSSSSSREARKTNFRVLTNTANNFERAVTVDNYDGSTMGLLASLAKSMFVRFNLAANTRMKIIAYSQYLPDRHNVFKRHVSRLMMIALLIMYIAVLM